ncbi:unnamed protein product [Brassicogethes aeneus]|uniref:DNA replication complex GINS protein PSF3 n=1 Tax=Brassicogethes aeneus TaxID=1431903 RepID=A0A9P0ATC3_BRAAE|nr:unnamed protein product [Brassicogethes aeneus]
MWLVTEMAAGRQPIVNPDLPKIYREAYREILKADASAVDLHKFNLYFYELGSYAKSFDAKGEVQDVLLHTFKTRFRHIMDLADNSISDPTVQQKLDFLERRIFEDGHKAKGKLNDWLWVTSSTMEAANMVVNHKKRKRVDLDESGNFNV